MGLFGGKKIYVASTVYNMAGDETKRPNYLKTMVIGDIITPDGSSSMSDSLTNGYLSGPGIKLRQFYQWTQRDYVTPLSFGSEGLAAPPDIDPAIVTGQIGANAAVQSVSFGGADYEIWAEQWMLENHLDQFNGAWVAEFNETSGEIEVTLPDGSKETFVPAEFNKLALYIFATYNLVTGSSNGPVVAGAVTTLAPGDAFPSTAGWTQDSLVTTPHTTPAAYDEIHGVWEKTEYKGDDGTGRLYSLKSIMYQDQTGADDGTGHLVLTRTWRTDTQEITNKSWSPLKIFIYRIGAGNPALDGSIGVIPNWGHFFPPIPVRINNAFLSDTNKPDVLDLATTAYKKLTGGAKFSDLIKKLETSDSLKDMDYIYVVPGISLNVKENSCRKYLYQFFENCMLTQLYTDNAYNGWQASKAAADTKQNQWMSWAADQGVPGSPLYNTPEPIRVTFPNAPKNMIELNMMQHDLNFDYQIKWSSISEEFGNGLAKVDAKVDEIWLDGLSSTLETGTIWGGALGNLVANDSRFDTIHITWQVDANNWRRLTIRGLEHDNYIYDGHSVNTKAGDALNDADESGFIVPLHYDTWNAMSIVDRTQMATACIFVVINSYQVVKQKWYQTGIFQIVLFIAIVVITVITGGGGAPLFSLGFWEAVGVAALNTIADMLLFKLLTVVAVAVFGDKIGTIVAAVAMILMLQFQAGLQDGQSLAQSFSHLMDPINLLRMTEAVGGGVAHLIQSGVQDTLAQTQDVLKKYNDQSKSISDLYAQNIGYDNPVIDPMSLTDTGSWYVEPGDTFLSRTLMTGSDIAELSTSLIGRFSDLTLSTDLLI